MQTPLERFLEARDRAPIAATSARGYVTVTRDHRGNVRVRLKPGTLSRLSERELAAEIHDGLAAALQEYADKVQELGRQIVGSDVFKGVRNG